jgi:hypothetical protein
VEKSGNSSSSIRIGALMVCSQAHDSTQRTLGESPTLERIVCRELVEKHHTLIELTIRFTWICEEVEAELVAGVGREIREFGGGEGAGGGIAVLDGGEEEGRVTPAQDGRRQPVRPARRLRAGWRPLPFPGGCD